jgi:hypothetical protein|tara:strand:- start:14975 stop:15193 length:219 start_codon:yes stop_codon:yes gene_type:complete
MENYPKFCVGDLICVAEENGTYEDYGIIFKVEAAGKNYDERVHYHIHWAIEQASTIEDDIWVEKAMQLIAKA